MGKASRKKREHREFTPPLSPHPRWAGAPGFDRAYFIAERFVEGARDLADVSQWKRERDYAKWAENRGMVNSAISALNTRLDHVHRMHATLEKVAEHRGFDLDERRDTKDVVIPGSEDRMVSDPFTYAKALAALASDHLDHMRQAMPIVFDPLSVPALSMDAVEGFGLPFPIVVADFLAPGGMSLPVQVVEDKSDWWVGLVAATVSQGEEGGPIDVWPTVMTLNAREADEKQNAKELMFGRVRFGGPLPPAPEGLALVQKHGADMWVVDVDQPDPWASLWIAAPALAAISALRILEAVNVSLTDVHLDRPARRRAEREGAKPALTVDITTGRATATASEGATGKKIDWQQRWTVRGHWKHFGEHTRVAQRHPSRVKDIPGHGRCVRIWCPPFVKGPADKPLVLKTRVVAHIPEDTHA